VTGHTEELSPIICNMVKQGTKLTEFSPNSYRRAITYYLQQMIDSELTVVMKYGAYSIPCIFFRKNQYNSNNNNKNIISSFKKKKK
jgi:hypothetical protein